MVVPRKIKKYINIIPNCINLIPLDEVFGDNIFR